MLLNAFWKRALPLYLSLPSITLSKGWVSSVAGYCDSVVYWIIVLAARTIQSSWLCFVTSCYPSLYDLRCSLNVKLQQSTKTTIVSMRPPVGVRQPNFPAGQHYRGIVTVHYHKLVPILIPPLWCFQDVKPPTTNQTTVSECTLPVGVSVMYGPVTKCVKSRRLPGLTFT